MISHNSCTHRTPIQKDVRTVVARPRRPEVVVSALCEPERARSHRGRVAGEHRCAACGGGDGIGLLWHNLRHDRVAVRRRADVAGPWQPYHQRAVRADARAFSSAICSSNRPAHICASGRAKRLMRLVPSTSLSWLQFAFFCFPRTLVFRCSFHALRIASSLTQSEPDCCVTGQPFPYA